MNLLSPALQINQNFWGPIHLSFLHCRKFQPHTWHLTQCTLIIILSMQKILSQKIWLICRTLTYIYGLESSLVILSCNISVSAFSRQRCFHFLFTLSNLMKRWYSWMIAPEKREFPMMTENIFSFLFFFLCKTCYCILLQSIQKSLNWTPQNIFMLTIF